MEKFSAQLKGLGHASALFRRQAAYGVFALLRSQPGAQKDIIQDVILTCLSNRHLDVVDESVSQLLQLAVEQSAVISCEDALHILLLAITSASSNAAPALAAGLVPLLQQLLQQILSSSSSSSSTAAAAAIRVKFPAGSRHPLCSALLSQPAAAAAISTAAVNWLAAALRNASPEQLAAAAAGEMHNSSSSSSSKVVHYGALSAVWQALRPFFSYVLLADAAAAAASSTTDSSSSGSSIGSSAVAVCLSQLLCLASSSAAAAELLLPFVLKQLLLWRTDTAAARISTIQALSDILDVIATHKPPLAAAAAAPAAAAVDQSWWYSACDSTGALLLLLAAQSMSPAAAGGSAAGSSVSSILDLMWRLGGVLLPGLWQQQMAQLAWLLLCCTGQQEQALVTKIILAQLTHGSSSSSSSSSNAQQQRQQDSKQVLLQPWHAAALQLPLLQQLVFSTNKTTKTWAAAALAQIRQQQQHGRAAVAAAGADNVFVVLTHQGPLASVQAVQDLLADWWSSSNVAAGSNMSALSWLQTLRFTLTQIELKPSSRKAAAAAASSSSSGRSAATSALKVPLPSANIIRDLEDLNAGDISSGVLTSVGNAAWFSSHGLNPALLLLLAALLQHPNARIVLATVDVLQQAVLLIPQIAPSFLPLVLQQLRIKYRSSSSGGGGGGSSSTDQAKCTAALLRLLPAMCKDTSTAALVWRLLNPILSAVQTKSNIPVNKNNMLHNRSSQQFSTAGLVRTVAVQLAVQAWQLTGRGWTRAEAAINGCIKPHEVLGAGYGKGLGVEGEPLELRLLRASAMRDVLSASTARGLELLGTVQSCLRDNTAPAVQALALASLETLFERDELDFYKAWPVVAKTLPPTAILRSVGIEPRSVGSQQGMLAAGASDGANHHGSSSGSGNGAMQKPITDAGLHTAKGLVAAHWVRLLRYGVLDAEMEPGVAVLLVQLLWLATTANEAQVRAAAYESLAAWPIPLLLKLEVPAAAAAYLAPLAAEAAALATAISNLGQQQQQQSILALEAHRSAIAAAERLAAAAIAHEHSNRRQFLAAAGSAARAAGGSSSSAAADREEAALRHRLIRTIPHQLTTAAAAAGSDSSPGALLLLWQASNSSSSSSADANAADHYAHMFCDISSRWASSAAAAGSSALGSSAGMTAVAWEAFMRRWLIAAGRTPEPILAKITPTWRSGLPAAAAAGIAAATGLAATGALGEGQILELVREFMELVSGRSRSSAVAAAAATALSRLLPTLHPSDWENKEAIVNTLYNTLLDCCQGSSSSSSLAAALVEALGHLGVNVLQHQQDDMLFPENNISSNTSDKGLALGCTCLGLLLSCVKAYSAAAAAGSSADVAAVIDDVISLLPGSCRNMVMIHALNFDQETAANSDLAVAAAKGCCCVLTALTNRTAAAGVGPATQGTAAAAAAMFGGHLLQQLASVAAASSSSGGGSSAAAWKQAVVAATPAAIAAAAAGSSGIGIQQQLAAAIEVCRQIIQSCSSSAADGRRAAAAAAVSWSQLICMQMAEGTVQHEEVKELVSWLTAAAANQTAAAAANASKGVSSSTAVQSGAAAALAVLLGVDTAAGSSGEWMTDLMAAAAAAAAAGPGDMSNIRSGTNAQSWGLLQSGNNTIQSVQLARSCLKALEAAAAIRGGSSSTVPPLAAWLLAAAAAATAAGSRVAGAQAGSSLGQTQAERSAASGSGSAAAGAAAAPALALYPATGALRPLAEKALGYSPSHLLHTAAAAAGSSERQQQQQHVAAAFEVAACIRCLAAAPRLPAADWAGLCRILLTTSQVSNPMVGIANLAVCQLQEATMSLLIAHCINPALELSGVLDASLNPAAFKQLNPLLQSLLLQQLGTVLAAMPLNRAAAVLQGLPNLVTDITSSWQQQGKSNNGVDSYLAQATWGISNEAVSNRQQRLLIILSAWVGLTNLSQAAADRTPPMVAAHKSLANALHNAVGGMAALLPLLPDHTMHQQIMSNVVCSDDQGEVMHDLYNQHQRQQCWGLPTASSSSSTGGGGHALDAVSHQWGATVNCLRLLNPDILLSMTAAAAAAAAAPSGFRSLAEQQQQQLLAIQLRSVLVLARKLSWKDLTECKHAFLAMPSLSAAAAAAAAAAVGSSDRQGFLAASSPTPARSVLLLLAMACATAHQAALLQQLQDLAAAAAVAAAPDNAAVLAAATLTAWLTAAGSSAIATVAGLDGGSAATAAAVAAASATEAHLLMNNPWKVLDQLPAVLPQLVSSHYVIGSKQGFMDAVCRVLLDLRGQAGLSAAATAKLLAAVAAVRELLPSNSSCWQDLLLSSK